MGAWSRLKRTLSGGSHRADIREELEFHVAMDVRQGREPREARLRLGNTTRIAEDTRGMGVVGWLESVWQDLHYAWRQLRHAPRLTAAIVLSLAIGLGANTAIATLVDAAILRPLPVAEPERLQVVEWTNDGRPAGALGIVGQVQTIPGGRMMGTSVSEPLYRALAAEQTAFASLIGVSRRGAPLSVSLGGAPAEQIRASYVSTTFFTDLVRPALGRPFLDAEDRPGAPPVAIVSDRFWGRAWAPMPARSGVRSASTTRWCRSSAWRLRGFSGCPSGNGSTCTCPWRHGACWSRSTRCLRAARQASGGFT
jgi:hypothetical protein